MTTLLKRLLALLGLFGVAVGADGAEPPALVIRGASVFTGDAFAPSAA